MKQLEKYAEHARDCREAADNARSDEQRQELIEMADKWESLARQRAAQLHLEEMLTELLKGTNGNRNGGAATA